MRFCLTIGSLFTLTLALPADDSRADRVSLALNTGGHTASICGAFFGRAGKKVFTVGHDNTVRAWDTATGETIRLYRLPAPEVASRGFASGLRSATLSPDARTLALGYEGGEASQAQVILLDLGAKGQHQVLKGLGKNVPTLAYAPDGKTLAVGSEHFIHLFDTETRQERAKLVPFADKKATVMELAFHPDGNRLAVVAVDGAAQILDPRTGKAVVKLEGAFDYGAAWSRDGKQLALAQVKKGVGIFKPDGTKVEEIRARHPGARVGLAFLPDGKRLLVGPAVYELPGGKEVARCGSGLGVVHYVGLANDGKLAVCGGDSGENTFLWSPADSQVVHDLVGDGQSPLAVAWARNGKGLAWRVGEAAATGRKRTAAEGWRAFDPATGRLTRAAEADVVTAVVKKGDLSLERKDNRVLLIKGKETVTLATGRTERGAGSFTFLGDNRAVVGWNHGLEVYDLATGKKLPTDFKGAGSIRSLAPSPDGKYFVSCSHAMEIKVWSPERDQAVLSLFVTGQDWIQWTPEGYYDATPGGERLMGWQVTPPGAVVSAFHAAARFRKSLYRPEVVRKVLEAGGTVAALQATAKPGTDAAPVEVSQVLPPAVTITAPGDGTELQAANLVVKAKATASGGHPVTTMQLLVDDRPYEGQRGIRAVTGRDVAQEKEWAVTLSPGPHRLAVLATSAVSTGRSETVEVTYVPAAAPTVADTRPALHVLAIGINEYDHGIPRLACAVADAKELAGCFQTHSKALFREVRPHLLLDKAATRAGVLQALAAVKQGMKEQDVLVISYAGHGYGDRDFQFFLLTQDADLDKLKETTLSNADLKRELADMPCGRVLLVLDACHSGNAGGVRPDTAAALANLERTLTDDDCGVVVMTAAKGTEQSLEADGHGFFTKALIEGLSGKADYNKDGLIHLTELDLHTFDQVRAWTKDRQHPSLGKPPTITSFPLAKP